MTHSMGHLAVASPCTRPATPGGQGRLKQHQTCRFVSVQIRVFDVIMSLCRKPDFHLNSSGIIALVMTVDIHAHAIVLTDSGRVPYENIPSYAMVKYVPCH